MDNMGSYMSKCDTCGWMVHEDSLCCGKCWKCTEITTQICIMCYVVECITCFQHLDGLCDECITRYNS